MKSPYDYFTEEFTNNYKKANPKSKKTIADLTKSCEKMWKMIWDNISDEEKKPYIDMSCLDEQRYANVERAEELKKKMSCKRECKEHLPTEPLCKIRKQ